MLNIAAAIVFFCSIFPVYWMVNMSLTPNKEIISRTPSFLPFNLDPQATTSPRGTARRRPGRPTSRTRCSPRVIVTVGVLVVTLLFAFLASVAVARFPSRAAAGSSSRCSSSR